MADAFTNETYNALCRDAEGYLARGLAEQARELLLKATSLIGTRARARSLLADACMQLTLWGEAKSQLEALATLEVDNIYTHFRLGQVLEETSEYELARDNFRVVLDMNPDHHGAKVSLSRLEKISSTSSPLGKTTFVEGQQFFPDSDDDGIFAGESSGSIDELLNTIGMGEKKDVPGVEDLLSSIGMNSEEEKKKEKPAVDFSSIFGDSSQKDDTGDKNPSYDVFNQDQPEQFASGSSDLSAIFGGSESAEEITAPAEEAHAPSLEAMFGGSESAPEPEAEASEEEPPAVESTEAEEDSEGVPDVSTESAEAEEDSEGVPDVSTEQSADLSAMFGGSESVEEITAPVEEAHAPDLDAMFGGSESAPEPEAEASEEEPPAVESTEAE
ncbi:MAG: tetratricopeptide repeat protein, partial [Candidatus Sabulitectum sp.]|nr:tetratricopeptide repeat protein [Candidatus Sabulitectum sp.]